MKPAGMILAGGRSRRMGGADKALAILGGRTLLAHVAAALAPQVAALAINSNGDPTRFAALQLAVIADDLPGRQGPLAGILTGLRWATRTLPQASHLLCAPCDIPGLPPDIGARLAKALGDGGAEIAVARDDSGLQPTIGLWPLALAERLAADMAQGARGVQHWIAPLRVADVFCHDLSNINTPDDLRRTAVYGSTI